MNDLVEIEDITSVSVLNAFELTIQEHEKALDFIPSMDTPEGVDASKVAHAEMRKTFVKVEKVRKAGKKKLEESAKAFHAVGQAAENRLSIAGEPHKHALDDHKANLKAIEEYVRQSFYDACQWLGDVVGACQFASTEEITAFIAEVEYKDQDNTGLSLSKDQKFEYAKSRMGVMPKLEHALQQRIIKDSEEARQQQAALELAAQQETFRQQQEEFEAAQQKQREVVAAQEAKELAEKNAKIQAEQAEKDAKLRLEQAEQATKQAVIDKDNAEKKAVIDAENNRIAEEGRLKAAQEQAAENERLRIQQEKEQAEIEEKERKANRAHKSKILGEAKAALMAKGITEEAAKEVLKLIAAGKVPHTTIKF